MNQSGALLKNPQKRMIQSEKVLFFTSFSAYGIIYINALHTNTSFNSAYMCSTILPNMTQAAHTHTKLFTKHQLILHLDNARPHISKITLSKINELGWKRMEYPPYSPEIAPNDIFLYGYVNEKLKGKQYSSRYELINEVIKICNNIPQNIWEKVYEEWEERLNDVVSNNGR